MMFSMTLAQVILKSDTDLPEQIVKDHIAKQLVFRADEDGVGYVENNRVTILDRDGKKEKVIPVANADILLYYSRDGRLITAKRNVFETSEDGKSEAFLGHVPVLFSQRDRFFFNHGVLSYLGNYEGICFQDAPSSSSAIGVDAGGTTIGYLGHPIGSAPVLHIWRKLDSGWVQSPRTMTPHINEVGDLTVMPGRNDIIFLTADYVAFVGGPCGHFEPKAFGVWEKGLVDLKAFSREALPNPGTNFLIVVRLADGQTKAYCKFKYAHYGEGRGFGVNSLVPSCQDKHFYALQDGSVVRFDTNQVLKTLGFLQNN